MKEIKVVAKFLRKGRYYVQLSSSFNGRKTIPKVKNYIWQKYGPEKCSESILDHRSN